MRGLPSYRAPSRRWSGSKRRVSRPPRPWNVFPFRPGEVAKIIQVIRELVSDTELLAFNAAIIAAKAGEDGKGFSVVADEIRDLADRTTASAQDIHRIVKAIGGDTQEVTEAVAATGRRIGKGKQLSLSTGEALRKIAVSSSQAARTSEEIAMLTREQGERARALLNDAGSSLRSVQGHCPRHAGARDRHHPDSGRGHPDEGRLRPDRPRNGGAGAGQPRVR